MEQDIDSPMSDFQDMLAEAFEQIQANHRNAADVERPDNLDNLLRTSTASGDDTGTSIQIPELLERDSDSVAGASSVGMGGLPISRRTSSVINDQGSTAGNDNKEDTIFDSCSEYIITGSFVTGNIINLSTHHIHVLTRPTIIQDERYERNALLFCVGFVLRRTEDPRPFRPVLSKLAVTFREMEIEQQFLTSRSTRAQLQSHLDRILVSLNSFPKWECNLRLSSTSLLNLKLFHPPKLPAVPVPDYAVPILLRRDRQVHMVRHWTA